MKTNDNVYLALRILDQSQAFELLKKSENLESTKNETFNGKVGFSSSCSNIILVITVFLFMIS
jgi:hypothetical protein